MKKKKFKRDHSKISSHQPLGHFPVGNEGQGFLEGSISHPQLSFWMALKHEGFSGVLMGMQLRVHSADQYPHSGSLIYHAWISQNVEMVFFVKYSERYAKNRAT